jgi:TonB family protein
MNSLELKEHLEDLDKKMSRIVPHLEVLSSKISSAEPHSSKFEEPLAREVEIPVRRPAEKPRLVLEETEEPVPNKPPVSTPFAGYAEPKRRRGNGAVIAMVILFAWIVGGLVLQETYGSPVWKRAGATVRDKYDALLEKAHTTNTEQVAANSSEPSPATAAVSDGSSAVNSPPPIEGNAPAQPIAEHTDTSVDASQAPESKYHTRSSRGTAHPVSAETIEKAPAERVPSSGNEVANAVNVAPAVMEEHLVASRVPAYPEKAKENRIEGPVVVQAIISKDGFVDRVHVLEGDPHLRSAAAEAVQKWRFKPYLLNGRPVEVATTITVDFKIDDW